MGFMPISLKTSKDWFDLNDYQTIHTKCGLPIKIGGKNHIRIMTKNITEIDFTLKELKELFKKLESEVIK